MAGKLGANNLVGRAFIGHQPRLTAQVGAHDRLKIGNANAVNVETTGRAATFNEGENNVFVGPCAPALLGLALEATIESLVNFHWFAARAHRGDEAAIAHGFANAMRQEPSGFIGDAQGAVKLMGANALL